MKFLADRVRMARLHARLKAKDVARRLDLSAGYYSELESGKKPISEELAEKLADILGVEMSSFGEVVSASTPRGIMRSTMLERKLTFEDLARLTRYRAEALRRVADGETRGSEEMLTRIAK